MMHVTVDWTLGRVVCLVLVAKSLHNQLVGSWVASNNTQWNLTKSTKDFLQGNAIENCHHSDKSVVTHGTKCEIENDEVQTSFHNNVYLSSCFTPIQFTSHLCILNCLNVTPCHPMATFTESNIWLPIKFFWRYCNMEHLFKFRGLYQYKDKMLQM